MAPRASNWSSADRCAMVSAKRKVNVEVTNNCGLAGNLNGLSVKRILAFLFIAWADHPRTLDESTRSSHITHES
jgi:hypothetical protein